MSKHEHGSMDTSVHEKTFAGFIKLSTYAGIGAICTLIFMAIVDG